jgi:hypothetical protein
MIFVINGRFGENAKKRTLLGSRPSTGGRVLMAPFHLPPRGGIQVKNDSPA